MIHANLNKKVIIFVTFSIHTSHYKDKKPEKKDNKTQNSNNCDLKTSEFRSISILKILKIPLPKYRAQITANKSLKSTEKQQGRE
jgi:hypothetical protein